MSPKKESPKPEDKASPKKMQARTLRRVQMLLESAATLFVSKGIDETSIDDIAAHAGVAKGAFYYHWCVSSSRPEMV